MQVENELIDAIKLADEDRAVELLKQWSLEVFRKDRTPHDYQISLIRLLNDLMIVMQENGIMLERSTSGTALSWRSFFGSTPITISKAGLNPASSGRWLVYSGIARTLNTRIFPSR